MRRCPYRGRSKRAKRDRSNVSTHRYSRRAVHHRALDERDALTTLKQGGRGLLHEVVQFLFMILGGIASAAWVARGMIADFDRRLAIVETKQSAGDNALTEIHTDVREIRTALLGEKTP
jgi:hypothetical protein